MRLGFVGFSRSEPGSVAFNLFPKLFPSGGLLQRHAPASCLLYRHAGMSGAPKPITGRCLCGGVTYSADAEPTVQAVCHCADCQRQTGNPFSVIVGVPRAAFKVEGSTLASFATTGEDHGRETHRNFCSA